jgi:hypothetical protein
MGRYYYGDIEGKFWFAVQPSDDPEFFGMQCDDSNWVPYYIDDGNMDLIEAGIKECRQELKGKLTTLRKWYGRHSSYTDKTASEQNNMTEEEFKTSLVWFARLLLGEKIHKCVKETGSCAIEAEY